MGNPPNLWICDGVAKMQLCFKTIISALPNFLLLTQKPLNRQGDLLRYFLGF